MGGLKFEVGFCCLSLAFEIWRSVFNIGRLKLHAVKY